MLVTVSINGGTVYRVDCDGCGLKDEHDRGPGNVILGGHLKEDDAYASAACTDCDNSPQIVRVGVEDLCRSCRVGGKMSVDERLIYDRMVAVVTVLCGDVEATQLLLTRIADCTKHIDGRLIPALGEADLDAVRFITDVMFADRDCTVNGFFQKAAQEVARRQ